MANIDVEYYSLDTDKEVILLSAKPDKHAVPYTFNGRSYERNDSSKKVMSQARYQQLLMNRNMNAYPWEDMPANGTSIDDLDHQEIFDTVREGIANGRIPKGIVIDDVEKILAHLDLIQDGVPTNAAIILFAKHPEKKFPQCLLKLARFRGTNHLADFIDNRQVSGNAFQIINEAMVFANRYLPIASTFPKGSIERKDTPLFPINALREVFANAVCHRDYVLRGGSISFAIFDDRLEVWNCGKFPHGMSIGNIKELHKSMPRNPKIANVLYYRKIIESWGRGIELIENECVSAGHPAPIFSQDALGVTVTLPSKQWLSPLTEVIDEDDTPLNKRQREILRFIEQHQETTLSAIKQSLTDSLAERTLQDDIAKLKKLNLVASYGRGKGARWFTIRHGITRINAD